MQYNFKMSELSDFFFTLRGIFSTKRVRVIYFIVFRFLQGCSSRILHIIFLQGKYKKSRTSGTLPKIRLKKSDKWDTLPKIGVFFYG